MKKRYERRRSSGRLCLTKFNPKKAAVRRIFGVQGPLSASIANGDRSSRNARRKRTWRLLSKQGIQGIGLAASLRPASSRTVQDGKHSSRRTGRPTLGLGAVLAGRLGGQAGDGRAVGRVDLDLGDHRRQDDCLQPHAHGTQPFRAGLLVGAVARGALPDAVGPQDGRDGLDLRRRHARVEKELREGREEPAGAADAHRQGHGPRADPRDGAPGGPTGLPGDDRVGGAVHRPVRHRRSAS